MPGGAPLGNQNARKHGFYSKALNHRSRHALGEAACVSEIACWFIDTDYNEESFFVRHAYFLGANDPYSALKTTLKAEINPEAWATLNSDTSRFREAEERTHRRQGHQPFGRRSNEGVQGVSGAFMQALRIYT